MGLFSTQENQQLEEARKRVLQSEQVCPSCKQLFSITGETLSAVNPALGLEAHKCPHCGHVITRRQPSPDGL